EATAAEVLVGRAVDHAIRETTATVVLEQMDLLELLREICRQIRGLISVQVGHDNVHRTGQVQEHAPLEAPIAAVLQPRDLSLVIAELRHCQVDPAVAVKVGRPYIGHARRILQYPTSGEPL